MCSQGHNLLSMQVSALDHDLTLLQKVMNAVWVCTRESEHIHTRMNDLQQCFFAQRVMLTKLSWQACSEQPAMTLSMKRDLVVNHVDTGGVDRRT